jgi:hypothetical protein
MDWRLGLPFRLEEVAPPFRQARHNDLGSAHSVNLGHLLVNREGVAPIIFHQQYGRAKPLPQVQRASPTS